jgi:methylenetetrahydrofolate reductase (NADPH)
MRSGRSIFAMRGAGWIFDFLERFNVSKAVNRGKRCGIHSFLLDLSGQSHGQISNGLFPLMKLSDAYGPGKFGLSFELFPPKTEAGDEELFQHLVELVAFEPSYITCTYGAGGSTRRKTLDVVERVRQRFGSTVASHLTCVGSTADELRAYLGEAHQRGVDNIVALRGDPPKGQSHFQAVDGGLRYASELVRLIRGEFPQFGIAVAGYPETHQEAPSPQADLENLQRKVAAGGDVVITQLFYDNADFFRFRDCCANMGIEVPIVPGVLPVTNLAQIRRITSLCGAKLPEDFVASLTRYDESPDEQFEIGVEFATRQVQELIDAGVPGIHFYVLNKSQATARVLRGVKLRQL